MPKLNTFLMAFCLLFAAKGFAQNGELKIVRVDQLKSYKIDQTGVYRDFTTGENQYDSLELSLSNSELEPFEGSLPLGVTVDTGSPRILKISYGIAKKKMLVAYEIPVFYRHRGGNFRLKSFDLQSKVSYHAPRAAARTFASNSVLASGTWYKIAVEKRGVFKMDYAFLQSLGVNPATINPANIRVFGNGGTVMNEAVSDGSPDDLVENAIEVKASGTTFGTSDYVLFYANGPVKWQPVGDGVSFNHTQNYYEDKSFYFVSFDNGVGKRIVSPNEITANPAVTITDFDAYAVIDKDSLNLSTMGKMWFSNKTYRSVASTIPVNLRAVTGTVRFDFQVAGATDAGTLPFVINYANNALANGSFGTIDPNNRAFFVKYDSKTFIPASSSFSLELKNNSTNINGILYLDYFRFNYKSPLSLSSTSLNFRSYQQASAPVGTVTAFKLTNGNSNVKIWDVTNSLTPENLSYQLSGNQITLSDSSAQLKEYIAFESSTASSPSFVSSVPNQNLHALAPAQYLIITDNTLEPAANKLADFHRTKYGTSVKVVTVDKIYNEFSSGGQDIGGIRNFIKMFYDRSSGTNQLKNVLLFGAASYDYKNRISNNTNMVPVYETYASNTGDGAYSSDEFYTLLDEGESILQNNGGAYIDVGIGRIPARSLADALAYVNKVEIYAGNKSFGEWKLNTSFVSDDYESGFNFLNSIEQMSSAVKESNWLLMQSKLYTDAAPRIATVGGVKFPSVTQGINNQIANGTVLMNYIGHGSPERWAVEEILYGGDVDKWSNVKKLPIIITATCDFGRFDDPADTAVGVSMVTKANGGAIATLTTTQSVYEGQNNLLNKAYLEIQFAKQEDGTYKSLGEAFADAKNYINTTFSIGYQTNSRKFVVLGDPALKPSLPENNIYADSIFERRDNGELAFTDTLKSLGKYVLKGHVADKSGNLLPDFNGQVYVTLLDKLKNVSATNPNLLADTTKQSTYDLQNNILFKGNTKVENGEFSINLILPKDINYDFGNGKLMLYAYSETEDAAGADTSFAVGGFSPFAGVDNQGPIVKPFIDDSRFRSGDIVSETPQLYVELADENGINVSGSSIGHDLIAIVDGAYDEPYVLNSYYQTASDDYSKGSLYYQLGKLEPGKHTLTVRAWDVYNNSGEGSIDFWVKGSDSLDFNLYNFPNPFNSTTSIVFQHNQPNVDMEVTLKIFSTNGNLVYDNQKNIRPAESFTTWQWNGTNVEGATVGNGVYLYQVSIKTSKQLSKTLYNKLVFTR